MALRGVVLLTGAAGALGSRLLPTLRTEGWRVRCLVHRRPVDGADEVVTADLVAGPSLERAVAGVDALLHLGAVTHARQARRYEEVNFGGTVRLLEAAQRTGVSRFVYVSTAAIGADSGYSRSKRRAEEAVAQSGLDHTIVRLPDVYGGQAAQGVDRIIAHAKRGASIPLVGTGSDELRPVYLDDILDPLATALTAPEASRRTYTLCGERLSMRAFAEACVRAFESSSRLVSIPIPAVAALCAVGRVLPLPVYPDQLARLRAPKPPCSPEARTDLGFSPRPLSAGLRSL